MQYLKQLLGYQSEALSAGEKGGPRWLSGQSSNPPGNAQTPRGMVQPPFSFPTSRVLLNSARCLCYACITNLQLEWIQPIIPAPRTFDSGPAKDGNRLLSSLLGRGWA